MSNTQCECVILSSVACPALQYFSTLPHKRHDLRKKLLNIKHVFWFSLLLLSEHFSFYEELSEIWQEMYIGLQVKYPLFLSDFNETYCSVHTEERKDEQTRWSEWSLYSVSVCQHFLFNNIHYMPKRRQENNIQMDMKKGLRCQGCRELGSIQWWVWVLTTLNLRITYQMLQLLLTLLIALAICSFAVYRSVLNIELTTLQILHCAVNSTIGKYKPTWA